MKCGNCNKEVNELELSDMYLCKYCEEVLKEEMWDLYRGKLYSSLRGEPDYDEDIDPQTTQAINQAVREIRRQQGKSNL